MPGKHKKPTGYKMKYQGDQSAFPFKDSPMKVAPIVYGAGIAARFGLRQAIKYAPRVVRGVRKALGKGPKALIEGPKPPQLPAVSTKLSRTKAKFRGVVKKYKKPAIVTGAAYGIGTIKGGQKSAKSQVEDKMKITTPTKPTTPKKPNGGSSGKISYKQAYQRRGKLYKDMSEADYIKEAKRQKAQFKKTGKWDVKKSYPKSK